MDSAAPPRSHRKRGGRLAASGPVSRQSGRVLSLGGEQGAGWRGRCASTCRGGRPAEEEGQLGVSRPRKGVSFLAGWSEVSHWCVVISDLGFHPCGQRWGPKTPPPGAGGVEVVAVNVSGQAVGPQQTALVAPVPLRRRPRALPSVAAKLDSRSEDPAHGGQGRGGRRLRGQSGAREAAWPPAWKQLVGIQSRPTASR